MLHFSPDLCLTLAKLPLGAQSAYKKGGSKALWHRRCIRWGCWPRLWDARSASDKRWDCRDRLTGAMVCPQPLHIHLTSPAVPRSRWQISLPTRLTATVSVRFFSGKPWELQLCGNLAQRGGWMLEVLIAESGVRGVLLQLSCRSDLKYVRITWKKNGLEQLSFNKIKI